MFTPTLTNVAQVKFFNPGLGDLISKINFPTTGVLRNLVTIPISPVENVTDELLFEEPGDATKKLYLPRYHIAERNGQIQVFLEPEGGAYRLRIHLEKAPAPKIRDQVRSAGELKHELKVVLKHRLSTGTANAGQKELEFEITPEAGGYRAVLKVESVNARDLLYQVLTESAYQPAFIIQRLFEIAIPAPTPPEQSRSVIASGTSTIRGNGAFNFDTGKAGGTADVLWEQQTATARRMLPRGKAQIVNLGRVDFNALSLAQLKGFKYGAIPINGSIGSNPNAVLLITPNWNPGGSNGIYNNHPTGVWLNTASGKWAVFNQDRVAMPKGAAFNVDVRKAGSTAFIHHATASNSSGDATFIDHPLTNKNPNAILMVTPSYNPGGKGGVYNNRAIGVGYNSAKGKWGICNQDRAAMPNGAAFNVAVLKTSEGAFTHRASAANITRHYTRIDHSLANNNPQAILLVTPNDTPGGKGGIYNNQDIGVWYSSSAKRWYVFNQDFAAMPPGAAFNVQIKKPGASTFAQRASTANISGNSSFLERSINGVTNQLANGDVFAVMTNSGNFAKVKVLEYGAQLKIQWVTYSKSGSTPGTALFRKVTRVLEDLSERNPFIFPANLYPHVFRGISGASGKTFEPILRQVPWQEIQRSYYQDAGQSHIFYYLPDAFKIARKPTSTRCPFMSIRFEATDGSPENIMATLEYCAFPFVNSARLKKAADELKQYVTDPLPPGGLVFMPLLADKTELLITLPRADGETSQEPVDFLVDLRAGFSHSLKLPLETFQGIFDAIFGASAVLMQGWVKVRLSAEQSENIPFIAQMNDLAGEIFDYDEEADQASGGIKATLRNAIESPVNLKQLAARLCRRAAAGEPCQPGTEASAEVRGLALPVEDLNPGEEVTFTLVPSAPPAGAGPLGAVFDVEAEVLPDREAVFDAILRPDSPAQYKRPIVVTVFKELFESEVQNLSIDFEGGGNVRFSRGNFAADQSEIEAQVNVLAPIKDLVVKTENPETYKYKMTAIRAGLKESRHQDWVTETSGVFYITSEDLPQ